MCFSAFGEKYILKAPPVSQQNLDSEFKIHIVQVPLSYDAVCDARKGADKIPIAVSIRKANYPEKKIGSLWVNYGGPGVGAIDGTKKFINIIPEDLKDRFDIVSMDPRGTGDYGSFLSDSLTSFAKSIFVGDLSSHQYQVDLAKITQNFQHMTTHNTACDINYINQALFAGRKLSFIGVSYGGILLSVFNNLFPDKLRAAVFDSPAYDNIMHTPDRYRLNQDVYRKILNLFTLQLKPLLGDSQSLAGDFIFSEAARKIYSNDFYKEICESFFSFVTLLDKEKTFKALYSSAFYIHNDNKGEERSLIAIPDYRHNCNLGLYEIGDHFDEMLFEDLGLDVNVNHNLFLPQKIIPKPDFNYLILASDLDVSVNEYYSRLMRQDINFVDNGSSATFIYAKNSMIHGLFYIAHPEIRKNVVNYLIDPYFNKGEMISVDIDNMEYRRYKNMKSILLKIVEKYRD